MRKEELPFEGMIDKGYKAKNMLKLNLVLSFFFIPILLAIIAGSLEIIQRPKVNASAEYLSSVSKQEAMMFLFYLLLYIIIIPYVIISIFYFIYLSSYIRSFCFTVSEDNIIIEHGVLTKTKVTIPYIKIQGINVISGFFDRLFKLFTVKIVTAGSESALSASSLLKTRREGQIPGLKKPEIIEKKINALIRKHSKIPHELEDKIFKPEELAFDNFISYILSKMRE